MAVTETYQKNSTTSSHGLSYAGPVAFIWFNETGPTTKYGRTREACGIDPSLRNANSTHHNDIYDCPQLEARQISIQLNQESGAYSSHCRFSTRYVETEIHCDFTMCTARRMRESITPHLSSNWTILDLVNNTRYYTLPGLFFGNFANAFTGHTTGYRSSALAGYISNPGTPFTGAQIDIFKHADRQGLENVSSTVISSRLSQILNSYWIIMAGSPLITGTDETWAEISRRNAIARYPPGPPGTTADSDTKIVSTASAEVLTPHRKLHCDIRWLFAFTAISALSLLSAISGLVLTIKTNTPRLSMNITSMLRDNQYSTLGPGGSYLDDSERSFLVQNTIVRIGDVTPNSSVGRIALCTIDATGSSMVVGRLDKKRLYD